MKDWVTIWEYELDRTWKPDDWQLNVLAHQGNVTMRCGRQVGKSVTIARKAGKFIIEHDDSKVLIIAPAQRQSSSVFEKVITHLMLLDDVEIFRAQYLYPEEWAVARLRTDKTRHFRLKYGIFKDLPTKTVLKLKNGSEIVCLPAGKSGVYLRCLTIDLLIADECAYVPQPVFTAIIPMLAVSKKTRGFGWEFYLSTPAGTGGYFYDCDHDDDFLHIHVSSEDCPRIGKDFLLKEQKRLSKLEYAQEYKGEYVTDYKQFFPTALIKKCMNFMSWEFTEDYDRSRGYYLGMDPARYGDDEIAFVVSELQGRQVRIVMTNAETKKSLTHTAGRAAAMDENFHFKKFFIDDGGLGAGITDMLLEKFGRRVVGLNNSSRSVNFEQTKKKKILKEDLYSNALKLMEQGRIGIIDDLSLLKSLKSMTFEYNSDKSLRIYGKYSHQAEAFVRACWCVKDKGLNLYVY